MKFIYALAVVAAVAFAEEIAVSTKMIAEINTIQDSWRAAHNYITRMPKSQARRLLGIDMEKISEFNTMKKMIYSQEEIDNAPESFDSRTKWPSCTTMKDIRDQRQCGSCWAFGAAEAMSDRICVKHSKNVRLSPEDILSCSGSCGDCDGGYPSCAWQYWVKTGVVTDNCCPYTAGIDPSVTPKCTKSCKNGATWANDKHKGEKSYTVSGEANMKTEISTHGPIEVAFNVYADFFSYSSGVYHHTSGGFEGGHAVKMLGYGTSNGVKYWLCANSWNTNWGEKGYFKIRRGSNECNVESEGVAGIAA